MAVHRLITAILLVCLVALPSLSCRVEEVHVIDGDTIRLSSGETIRYIGIDTPEKGEPYYDEATRANRQLVQNRSLRYEADVTNRDQYGRLLRHVFAKDTFVNVELVRQGLALVYSPGKFPDERYIDVLIEAADEAAAAGIGIWSEGFSHPKLLNNREDYFVPGSVIG